jgi:hypothetical protein
MIYSTTTNSVLHNPMSIAAVATAADDNDPYQQQQQLLKSLNLSLQ